MNKLSNRLELTSENDTDSIVNLINALGNMGTEEASDIIEYYLEHHDIDVQLTAISGLRMHISQLKIQEAFENLLQITENEEVNTVHVQCFCI